MTKYEFLGDLSRLLSDLPEEERMEAMEYYEDYFSDAGRENEAQVIKELGSPERIAAQIKGESQEPLEYGDNSTMKSAAYPDISQQTARNDDNTGHSYSQKAAAEQNEPWTSQPLKIVLLVILAIAIIPVGIPIITTIFGLFIGLLSLIFGLFVALFASGFGIAIAGAACIISGFAVCATTQFASGILGIGIGLILLPIGIILFYCGIVLCCKLIPVLFKLCKKGFQNLGRSVGRLFS